MSRRQARHRAATTCDRPDSGRLREWIDAGVKRKAIENEPNGDPNDSAPERLKTPNLLFVL
ncbi:hypothetical protein WL88_27080 [Burkholderia diffusa]|uniref:Uncharacterized protein n=1 Tax=Burkholderia diffusa TaxID=488732 RepID=A0AAW3P9G0_9BURK|nr:hypothetical protein WI26_09440 [Burkholderia diffusa]KUZ18270.1 hypothetical protein WI28_03620 [Burkholderia diffusa]KVC10369.1 hypothetical protein WI69_28240 [Burkholderia diffusa]KVC43780.1 hypothetical protein WI71_19545 [Burkholderia diffusa]KVG32798.1 hypothetical protein WJ30_10510 [Burkholderia diffusa]